MPLKMLKKLFNLRHTSLCNAIERAFGILKRFPIIASATRLTYLVDTQIEIILVCCIGGRVNGTFTSKAYDDIVKEIFIYLLFIYIILF